MSVLNQNNCTVFFVYIVACNSAFLVIVGLWIGFAIGLFDSITSNSLFSLILFKLAFWSLCAYTLLTYAITCSLVTELNSLI